MSNYYYAARSSRSTREAQPHRSYYTASFDGQAEWNQLRRQQSQYATTSGRYTTGSTDRHRFGSVVSPLDPRQHIGRNSPVSPLNSRRLTPRTLTRSPSLRPRRPGYDGVAFAQASGGLDGRYFTSTSRPESSVHRAHSSNTSRGGDYTGSGYGRYASLNAGTGSSSRPYTETSSRYAFTASPSAATLARYDSERYYRSGQQHGGYAPSSSAYQLRNNGRTYTANGWQ